jgi:uncharacterized tellurite resistance protein B-like protein
VLTSPGMTEADVGAFRLEVMKLLLQVAWADHSIHEAEAAAIEQHAKEQGYPPEQIAMLDEWLSGRAPLPQPNFAVLRPRRTEVLRQVRRLLHSDQHVAEEEEQVLTQIAELLSG